MSDAALAEMMRRTKEALRSSAERLKETAMLLRSSHDLLRYVSMPDPKLAVTPAI